MRKQKRDIFLAGLAVLVAAGLFFWSRQTTPDAVAQALFDLNLPSRIVLLADKGKPQLASVDLLQRSVQTLALPIPAEHMAIDKTRGMLVYAQGQDAVLRHLTTYAEQRFAVPHAVRGLVFVPKSGDVWVWGDDALAIVDNEGGLRHTIEGFSALQSVHLDALGERIVAVDAKAVWFLSLMGGVLQRDILPDDWTVTAPSALSPTGDFVLFAAQDANNQHFAVIRQEDGAWQHFPIAAPLLRPLADNAAQQMFFVATNGQGIRVTADDMAHREEFATVPQATHMALGWLDSRLLVAGVNEMWLHDAQTLAVVQKIVLPAKVNDVFITADSKTALLTMEGHSSLFLLDMREGSLQSLALSADMAPHKIMMGASYTLCH